ncbi:Uncharacterised protein [Mycobacterium tuberculosis]|uniref:Uncharacterized protein n=1 Tax=Mycobacterium tuberculosis TaxID=1773 RepID=A0A654U7A5_MYCTX|nr:Uncharacterised protein [Mycobacterium tuberculosis]CFS40142.1 Uncharacterised protein [Mycobacterium tuberculosis]CPA77429.1 Uncharacterised protein [Mycobacterium tuberculosis]
MHLTDNASAFQLGRQGSERPLELGSVEHRFGHDTHSIAREVVAI